VRAAAPRAGAGWVEPGSGIAAAPARSSARLTSAASASQLSRALPPVGGMSGCQPVASNAVTTASRSGVSGSVVRVAARSATIACRISARSKNRSAPRTTTGTPASANASS
jgi:hypothetical protein